MDWEALQLKIHIPALFRLYDTQVTELQKLKLHYNV